MSYGEYTYGWAGALFDGIAREISEKKKEERRISVGITRVDGLDGVPKLGITNKYQFINYVHNKFYDCYEGGIHTLYDAGGKRLFDCEKYDYLQYDMFLVQCRFLFNSDALGERPEACVGPEVKEQPYALFENSEKKTDYVFRHANQFCKFNEQGFAILDMAYDTFENVVVDRNGDIIKRFSGINHQRLYGVILYRENDWINLLTGVTFCNSYHSALQTKDLIFIQADSDCVMQANIHTGQLTVHGQLKVNEDPKPSAPEPKKEVEPPAPKQNRNDLCACGSGKKFKNCCIGK